MTPADSQDLEALVPLVRAIVRHRKTAWALLGCAVAGLVAAGGLAARASYQAAQWETVKAAQGQQRLELEEVKTTLALVRGEQAAVTRQLADLRMDLRQDIDGVRKLVLEVLLKFTSQPQHQEPRDGTDHPRDQSARPPARPGRAAGRP